jgi:RNA polymerase-interacting CarD/CdnL/TRCF family regulator
MEISMMLTVGAKVVYPSRGPCLIGEVVKKVVGGQTMRFYPLAPLDDSKGELFVPVENLADLHLRALLDRSEIPQLLRRLEKMSGTTKKPDSVKNWRQRNTDNAKLLSSGSAFDLAAVIESLTSLSEAKSLSPYEREIMARARRLLVCEISEVTGESKSMVEEQITEALHFGRTV